MDHQHLKDQIRAHRRRLREIRETRQSVQTIAALQQLQKEEELINHQLDILLEELRLLSDITYGMIALFEDTPGLEMDTHTEMTCHGLKYILDQTDEVREKAEGILIKAIRPFLPPSLG